MLNAGHKFTENIHHKHFHHTYKRPSKHNITYTEQLTTFIYSTYIIYTYYLSAIKLSYFGCFFFFSNVFTLAGSYTEWIEHKKIKIGCVTCTVYFICTVGACLVSEKDIS
jgi:hypothetical protein